MSEWRTYRPGSMPVWMFDLPAGRIRNVLMREVGRLSRLVDDGVYADPKRTPIPLDRLDDLRHDLELWNDPEAVLRLLRGRGYIYIRNMGPKTRQQAIEMIEAL